MDNIVFEGRLDTWPQFADLAGPWDEVEQRQEEPEALHRGLVRLGTIVIGYDVAPRQRMFERDLEDPQDGHDGLLIPLMERRRSLS